MLPMVYETYPVATSNGRVILTNDNSAMRPMGGFSKALGHPVVDL